MSTVAKLRYMAKQYTAGQVMRGGDSGKHYLDEAADEIESLQQKLDEANRIIAQQKVALAEFIEKSACIGRVN